MRVSFLQVLTWECRVFDRVEGSSPEENDEGPDYNGREQDVQQLARHGFVGLKTIDLK